MTECRDMDKNIKNAPKMGVSPICDHPKDFFFKNRALSLLYPYGALTSCKKLEKSNERALRYLKTKTHTDKHIHGQGRLLGTPSARPGVQKQQRKCLFLNYIFFQKMYI